MARIGAVIVGIVVGAGLMLGALNYHVLKTDKGFEFIPKRSMSLADTYVDVREFGVPEWSDHVDLVKDIFKAEKGDLIKDATVENLKEGVESLWGKVRGEQNLR
jgi:hypothetical protein